jgi:hypothetical protein
MTTETTPDVQSARADLAFMRSLAEDKDPLSATYGWHLFTLGVCFGPMVLFTWAALAGVIDVPESWANWSWAPATVIYTPILLWLLIRGNRGRKPGPTQRAVWYTWAGVGQMTLAIVLGLIIASGRLGPTAMLLWPQVALALYGGSWTLTSLLRGARWHGLLALGCYVASVVAAYYAGTPTQWLVLGLGILVFLGGPGVAIILKARAPA